MEIMMNDELATLNEQTLALEIENPYEEELKEALTAGAWLPRFRLFTANSDQVKSEKIIMDHYGLEIGKDNIEDLGREVDVLLITIRPRALDVRDTTNVRASSIIKSELYQDIKDIADNTPGKSGCLYGPEFLIYVPSKGVFATCHFNNPTARNEAGKVNALMLDEELLKQGIQKRQITPATFKSKLIDNKKNKWKGMMATRCSTPFSLPSTEDIQKVVNVFLHPKEISGLEEVKVEEISSRVR
jgi:hypothetical protein